MSLLELLLIVGGIGLVTMIIISIILDNWETIIKIVGIIILIAVVIYVGYLLSQVKI